MKRIITLALVAMFAACNSNSETAADKGNADKEKELNDRSKECIRIMNRAETDKQQALANGDSAGAEAAQKTIDSAARANAMIGQEMMQAKDK